MAVFINESPALLTAAGDQIGNDGNSYDVAAIRVVTTTTPGVCVLLTKAGGREIWRSKALNADDQDWLEPGEPIVMRGIYVLQLPVGARLFIYFT